MLVRSEVAGEDCSDVVDDCEVAVGPLTYNVERIDC